MAMADRRPSPAQIRESVARLVREPDLARSQQLVDILVYVVERSLAGDEAHLNAYYIGTDVLGRDAGFDPQIDSIVRVQARRLRTVLDTLYRRGVPGVTVHIHLPVGHYIPRFTWLDEEKTRRADLKRFKWANMSRKAIESEKKSDSIAYRVGFWWKLVLSAVVVVILIIAAHVVVLNMLTNTTAETASGKPVVIVGNIEAVGDLATDDIRVLKSFLVQRLTSFDQLDVRLLSADQEVDDTDDRIYRLGGQVQSESDSTRFNVVVTRHRNAEVIWSHGYVRPVVEETRDESLKQLADQVAADIGTMRGAVQTDARHLLPESAFSGSEASDYSCRFLFRDALGPGREAETKAARRCYAGILSIDADNAMARAVLGALDGFDVMRVAAQGDNRASLLHAQVADGENAIRANPVSSFAHEVYGHILWGCHDF